MYRFEVEHRLNYFVQTFPNGGSWIIKVRKKNGLIARLWEELVTHLQLLERFTYFALQLFACVGELFEEPDICGPRQNFLYLQYPSRPTTLHCLHAHPHSEHTHAPGPSIDIPTNPIQSLSVQRFAPVLNSRGLPDCATLARTFLYMPLHPRSTPPTGVVLSLRAREDNLSIWNIDNSKADVRFHIGYSSSAASALILCLLILCLSSVFFFNNVFRGGYVHQC
jgi:hypothetical protein